MKEVTDPDVLKQLETPGGEVTDPALLAELEGGSIVDPLFQGATLGFYDEGTAAVSAPITALDADPDKPYLDNLKSEYKRIRDQKRADYRAFQERAPGTSMAAEFAGGIPAGMGVGGPIIRGGLNTMQRFGRAVGTGLGFGGVAGAGYSEAETLPEFAGDVSKGAAIGGGFGAALEPASYIAQNTAGRLINNYFRKPRNRAESLLVRDVQRDQMTPERVQARMNKMGPNATMADVGGEEVMALTDAVANRPGPARNILRNRLYRRDRQQAKRIAESTAENLGVEKNYYKTLEELDFQKRAQARPLYRQAYEEQIPYTDELKAIVNTPVGKESLTKAKRLAANEGIELPLVVDDAGNLTEVPDMQTWDYIKRAMDDVVYDTSRNAFGGVKKTDEARTSKKVLQRLLEELDSLNPTYAQARGVYSRGAQSERAIEAGFDFMKTPAELTEKQIANLSDTDKEFFRIGVYRSIMDTIEKTPDTSDVTKRLFNKEGVRKKLKAAFPDERSFRRFTSDMLAESRMFRTKARITGGSPTQLRQSKARDIEGGDAQILDALDPQTGIMRRVANKLVGYRGIDAETSAELAKLLLSSDPKDKQYVIEMLARQQGRIPLPERLGIGAQMSGAGLLAD